MAVAAQARGRGGAGRTQLPSAILGTHVVIAGKYVISSSVNPTGM